MKLDAFGVAVIEVPPAPPVNVTVGALVYPIPGFVMVITPAVETVAVAPDPPPPVIETVGELVKVPTIVTVPIVAAVTPKLAAAVAPVPVPVIVTVGAELKPDPPDVVVSPAIPFPMLAELLA